VLVTHLRRRYATALREYLSNPVEATLSGAQVLGREAHAGGLTLAQMTAIHHHAMTDVLWRPLEAAATSTTEAEDTSDLTVQLAASASSAHTATNSTPTSAETFFAESISCFEGATRDAEESRSVLAHQKRQLEHRARRIGSQICESTKQVIALIHLELAKVAVSLPPDAHASLSMVSELLDQIDSQLAGFSLELWPTKILEHLGLIPAVEFAAKQISSASGIPIRVQSSALPHLTPDVEALFFRTVDEALANIQRHSRATLAFIRLDGNNGTTTCTVSDDGVGFEPSEIYAARGERGLGLIAICRDVQSAGGTFTVRSALGHGTELSLALSTPESASK
jgi:signal transduction histidine kinase